MRTHLVILSLMLLPACENPTPPEAAPVEAEARAALNAPPPVDRSDAAVPVWQAWCEQFRSIAEAQLTWKAGTTLYAPYDPAWFASHPGSAAFVGGRSFVPGNENRPVFFRFYPANAPQLQLYAFTRGGDPLNAASWAVFEVTGAFFAAYNDDRFTHHKLGTNSVLGYPESGREPLTAGNRASFPFSNDSAVSAALARGDSVFFQNFQGGWLVDIRGNVLGFDKPGNRLGSAFGSATHPALGVPYLTGSLETPCAPGTSALKNFNTVFERFEVSAGAFVPSRLGTHFGTLTNYRGVDVNRLNRVADELQQAGFGFLTVIVDAADPEGMHGVINTLRARGIQPIVRLLPEAANGGYNRTADQWSNADLDRIANAAATLASWGVIFVQLDNEPNVNEGGKTLHQTIFDGLTNPGLKAAYDTRRQQYAGNLRAAILRIKQRTSALRIGFGSVVAGNPAGPAEDPDRYARQFFTDLMWDLRYYDQLSPGRTLLDGTWLAVHPYTNGGLAHYDGADRPMGVPQVTWYRDTMRGVLGRPELRTLATEGGNRLQGGNQVNHSGINQEQLRLINLDAEATQNVWLFVGKYLNASEPQVWEDDALFRADESRALFLTELRDIAHGLKLD